ncbi:hypothetical protein GCM10007981_04000 [Thermocladium modestius]|uniref:LexA repressor DNA-binding domain-containing protein n=1 Tax=Thermocladium modestius TaxID=62609 RepID=A0A830GSJ5_9CREN|nr:hypothetical protein GCM10007981_04000 [Thermocladium modestius]
MNRRNDVGNELGDTALRVYLLLVSEGRPMSIREVQRSLSLSSPGVAYHHLERLRRLGLAVKEEGGYVAVRRNGVVEGLIIIGSKALPRAAFYLGFSASLAASYAVAVAMKAIALDPMAAIPLAALVIFSSLEFKEQWSKLRGAIK